jgi:hypothetical protein
MAVTEDKRQEILLLLKQIGPYATHLSDCAHWTEQTAEFCTCGLGNARKAWNRIHELLE